MPVNGERRVGGKEGVKGQRTRHVVNIGLGEAPPGWGEICRTALLLASAHTAEAGMNVWTHWAPKAGHQIPKMPTGTFPVR